MNSKWALLGILLSALAGEAARADSALFTFTGNGTSLPVNPSGLNLIITTTPRALSIDDTRGLGVLLGGNDNLINPGEEIIFHFDSAVQLTSITFTDYRSANSGGSHDLADNPLISFSNDGVSYSSPVDATITAGNTFTFSSPFTSASYFKVGAQQLPNPPVLNTDKDNFGIGSFNVNYTPTAAGPSVTAVPLPPAVWSGLGTLAGLGLIASKRRRGSKS